MNTWKVPHWTRRPFNQWAEVIGRNNVPIPRTQFRVTSDIRWLIQLNLSRKWAGKRKRILRNTRNDRLYHHWTRKWRTYLHRTTLVLLDNDEELKTLSTILGAFYRISPRRRYRSQAPRLSPFPSDIFVWFSPPINQNRNSRVEKMETKRSNFIIVSFAVFCFGQARCEDHVVYFHLINTRTCACVVVTVDEEVIDFYSPCADGQLDSFITPFYVRSWNRMDGFSSPPGANICLSSQREHSEEKVKALQKDNRISSNEPTKFSSTHIVFICYTCSVAPG